MARIYQQVLGIGTGDIVKTSYNTGPYEVCHFYGPYFCTHAVGAIVVRTWPVVSLILHAPGDPNCRHHYYINDVRQEGERWFDDSNNEIFVAKPDNRQSLPIDMFLSYPQATDAYDFAEGVDYTAGDGRIWKCDRHGDFNGRRASRHGPACCPICGRFAELVIVMELRVVGERQTCAYIRTISAPPEENPV